MKNNEPHAIATVRRLCIAMLAFLPWLSACANDAGPPKPPLSLPFEVQKAGNKVETELRVVEHRGYIFALLFMYKKDDQEDRARVRKLAGEYEKNQNGELIEPGVPILLRLKIDVIDDSGVKTMLEQEISELRMTSYGAVSFNKRISAVPLKPGHYRISVESLKDVPELLGTPVIFQIGRDPKTLPIS